MLPLITAYCGLVAHECACVERQDTHAHSCAGVLDSSNGHLRTSYNVLDDAIPFNPRFCPLEHDTVNFSRWYVPYNFALSDYSLVAKVQPFKAGGYEVTVSWLSIPDIVKNIDAPRSDKRRVYDADKPMLESDLQRSIQRSKKNTRLKIKNMGADRILTLTRRQSIFDYWTVEQWAAGWKKFNRLLVRAGCPIQYVAVLELHKTGFYHLHAAICGKVNVKLLRRCWLIACGGRGYERGADSMGNIDVSYRPNITPYKRSSRISRYISKYLTKQGNNTAFNKKRYWSSSGSSLPLPSRYVLRASDFVGSARSKVCVALLELAEYLGLDELVLLDDKRGAFIFPNSSGAWFSFDDSLAAIPPF